jgi:hypothetical protein
MVEQKQTQAFEERFQFKLFVNDHIVCQRYFKINKFNEESLSSTGFKDIIDLCARMIDEDLKSKTRVYLGITAPIVMKNIEQMTKYLDTVRPNWVGKTNYTYWDDLEIGSTFYISEEKRELVWDGKQFNETRQLPDLNCLTIPIDDEENPTTFKFVFLDDDKEIMSKIWSGNYYPKFVRHDVDLSNKRRGKTEEGEVVKNFDSGLRNAMTMGKGDLVYTMIKLICEYCSSSKKEYETTVKYGDNIYYFEPKDRVNEFEYWVGRKYCDERHKSNIRYVSGE